MGWTTRGIIVVMNRKLVEFVVAAVNERRIENIPPERSGFYAIRVTEEDAKYFQSEVDSVSFQRMNQVHLDPGERTVCILGSAVIVAVPNRSFASSA
jgi:hypothetical protein